VATYEQGGSSHIHLFEVAENAQSDFLIAPNFLRVATLALEHFHPGSRPENHSWHYSHVVNHSNIDWEPAGSGGYKVITKGSLARMDSPYSMSEFSRELEEGPYYALNGIEGNFNVPKSDITTVNYVVPAQFAPHGLIVMGDYSPNFEAYPHTLFATDRLYDGMVQHALRRHNLNSVDALKEQWQEQVRWTGESDCTIPAITRSRIQSIEKITACSRLLHDFMNPLILPSVAISYDLTPDINNDRNRLVDLFNLGAEFVPATQTFPSRAASGQMRYGMQETCGADFRQDTISRMRMLPLIAH
jgi:hypothetical protein